MVLDFTEPYYLDPEPYPAQSPVDMQPVLLFPSHEEQPIFYPASLSQALIEHALPTHLLKSICSLSCFVRDFSSKLLTWWCRSHCLEVVVQHWLLRAPPLHLSSSTYVMSLNCGSWNIFFPLALCSKAFIVSLLFLNSCAYLWCYCKWCKYLSKKSLHWAADCPLIFSTLKVWIIISLPTTRGKKKLAKFGNALKEYCSCISTCCTKEKNVPLRSTAHPCSCNSRVYNLLWLEGFADCFLLLFLLWFAAITLTNWWWCHRAA